jgi:hypothetical protein
MIGSDEPRASLSLRERVARIGASLACAAIAVTLAATTSLAFTQAEVDGLKNARNTLFADWVARQKEMVPPRIDPNATLCQAWAQLPESAKGVFLTITHRLAIAKVRVPGDFVPLLNHVSKLYSIRGQSGGCGGEDANRLFLSISRDAWHALMAARLDRHRDDPEIRDFGELQTAQSPQERRWRNSGDGNRHHPFNASVESARGRVTNFPFFGDKTDGAPRAQLHFYDCDPTAPARERGECNNVPPGASRGPDLVGVQDDLLLEMDQDYNLFHASATECRYGNDASGRARYERNYCTGGNDGVPFGVVPPDFGWTPTCGDPGGGGGCTTCGSDLDCNSTLPVCMDDGCCHGI